GGALARKSPRLSERYAIVSARAAVATNATSTSPETSQTRRLKMTTLPTIGAIVVVGPGSQKVDPCPLGSPPVPAHSPEWSAREEERLGPSGCRRAATRAQRS